MVSQKMRLEQILDYLCKTVELAIKCGATTINIPDTVGYATPSDYERIIKDY